MKTGLMAFLDNPHPYVFHKKVALLGNATSVTCQLIHAAHMMHAHPDIDLVQLFAPEHGMQGTAQYMVATDHTIDTITGLPVISLYGQTYEALTPAPQAMQHIDVLICDIQDIGVRYYTYTATMALCMRAAEQAGVHVIVLDRPNPIGGLQIEGGGIQPGLENFCGLFSIPQRHGLTIGELARLYQQSFGIACSLEVIPCQGWQRQQYFNDLDIPWVMPSPNMPTLDTALVYAGMCLLEGTNISEGRGTTRPFEIFGAPFINSHVLLQALRQEDLPGVHFRPCAFEPTFDKFTGQICHGLQIHVTDRQAFLPYRTGIAIVWHIHNMYPKAFTWRNDTYEFRKDVPAFDLLTGNALVRQQIETNVSVDTIMQHTQQYLATYQQGRDAALLYE